MNDMNLIDVNLHLFGESAAVPAGGEGAVNAEGESSSSESQDTQEERLPKSRRSRRKKSDTYANVVFGKQEDVPDNQTTGSDTGSQQIEGSVSKSGFSTTSDALEAKRQAYRELIEGEYREQYIEDTQRILNARMKKHSTLEASMNAQKPIMDMLMQRYKVAEGDFAGLQKAMENDTEYWERAADEAGMPVEQFKQHQQWERDSMELRQLKQNQQNLNQMYRDADQVRMRYPEFDFRAELKDQTFVNLLLNKFHMQRAYEVKREAAQVKKLYPGFNLKTESADRNFLSMLRAGVPVQQAYEVKHMGEITQLAARNAAMMTGQQMTARMKTKALRPSENGTESQSAVIVKSDVSKLTRKDRAEIARRVARGEKISF